MEFMKSPYAMLFQNETAGGSTIRFTASVDRN